MSTVLPNSPAHLDALVADAVAASGWRFVVTGAGGWLGMATLELLEGALSDGFSSRVRCFGARARSLELASGRRVRQHALTDLTTLNAAPTMLLHLAFLGKERADAMTEADYRAGNRVITAAVLGAAERIDVRALFLSSSGAAAHADDDTASPALRLYGGMKREDEVTFGVWAERAGVPTAIARIYSLSGRYMNKRGSYALAQFIEQALAGGSLSVNATRPVIRSYVAIDELMSLAFAILCARTPGPLAFDSGGAPIEVGELADAVARTLGGGPVARAPMSDAPADSYAGDGERYAALLEEHGIRSVSLREQILQTAAYMAAHDGQASAPMASHRAA